MKKEKAKPEKLFQKLREVVSPLKNIKENEVHILNIRANYGNYQVIIAPSKEAANKHKLEINGQIHHLFVSPDRISAKPSELQVKHHMKDTIILRDLNVHLVDKGRTHKPETAAGWKHAVEVREKINLAGKEGSNLLQNIESNGKLSKAAYDIIEEDIIQALNDRPEESVEDVSVEYTME